MRGYDPPVLDRLRRIRPATAIALVALFASLTGTAAAITVITGKNVKDGSLTGKDVKNGSLTSADLSRGTVTKGARGPAGPEGPAGPKGDPGSRGPQGAQGEAGAAPWADIPSGQLVTGSQRVRLEAGPHSTSELMITVALPGRAPVALTTTTVNFANQTSYVQDGDDAHCLGSGSDPVPEAGYVCLYPATPENVTDNSAKGEPAPDPRSGFAVAWTPADSATASTTEMSFVWAYRAP